MINIIYTCKAEWEEDWLKDVLFKGVEFKFHTDPEMKLVLPNSVIILNETDEAKVTLYLKKFESCKYRFGIVHLSDEAYMHPISYYERAEFVFRNYYSAQYDTIENVEFFPLGWKAGMFKGHRIDRIPASSRLHTWNFVGQIIGKPTREAMANAMSEIEGGYLHITRHWDDPDGLDVKAYQNILENSAFTACPAGWCNPDSFRVCEALEAGSIPIVDNRTYFEHLFQGHVPFLSTNTWEDFTKKSMEYEAPDQLQQDCIKWWEFQKKKFNFVMKEYLKGFDE